MKVAIDGPAGSGKSTVSKIISNKFDLLYIDTGAMYRACAYISIKFNLSNDALIQKVANADIVLGVGDQRDKVFLEVDGEREDISDLIRMPDVTSLVSTVAANSKIRDLMTAKQQIIAEAGNVIMDGRDIGTVVIPNADIKVFLTASDEERAKRRYDEWIAKGKNVKFDDVLSEMLKRDKDDLERDIAPLLKADDAVEVNTTGLDINGVVDVIAKLIETSVEK